MHLTVEEALHLYPLTKAKLVAGAKGASRIIRSVNMMDAPDVFNWVKTGEMLFTTAFAIKDAPDDFLRLLEKLNERGSAGLGIKLGRYWSQIPDVVIKEADRLDFPIIELPFEFTFSDQMNALVQAEIAKSTKKLHDALDKQKHLMRFAIQPGASPNHFQKIGEILAHPITVIGARGQMLYNTSDWPQAEITAGWPWEPKFDKARKKHGWRCRIPLMQDEDCCGFLLVMPYSGAAIQEEEGLFHQAAELLSFQMDRLQDERETVTGYRWSQILERYLGRRMTPELFLEQARSLRDPELTASYLCVKTVPTQDIDPSADSRKPLRAVRRELMYHPYLAGIETHHLFLNGGLVSIFIAPESILTAAVLPGRIAEVLGEALEFSEESGLHCFISKPKYALADILEAYEECEQASEISSRLSSHHKVTMFSDLEFNYLFRYIPQEAMAKYCANVLRPLMHKEEGYAGEMLHTLEVFFENEGHINGVAKQLFIHRNTVFYRLEKISELLGVDLHKTSDLLQLKLAFVFRQLLRSEGYAVQTKGPAL